MVIKMLTKLESRIEELRENFDTGLESIIKNQPDDLILHIENPKAFTKKL